MLAPQMAKNKHFQEKNPKNNIQNEKEIKEIKNSENEIKIKKPIISKEDYEECMERLNHRIECLEELKKAKKK